MTEKPLAYVDYPSANVGAEPAFAVLGTMTLGILAIEVLIGGILLLVSGLFFATIFFAFVGFILFYMTLWIAVFFNAFGVAVSLLTLLAGRRYLTGKVFGVSGLLIHAVLLGAGIYGLASIHNHLAQAQQGSPLPAATYSVETQEMQPRLDLGNDQPRPSESLIQDLDRQESLFYLPSNSFSKYSFEWFR